MPIYHQLGRIPRKRHVAFRKDDGGIHYEELVGNQGFTGPASLLYHLRLPTVVKSVQQLETLEWVAEPERVLRHRHFRTAGLATGPSAVRDRVPLLFNADVALSVVRPRKQDADLLPQRAGRRGRLRRRGPGDPRVVVRRAALSRRRLRRDPARDPAPLARSGRGPSACS